MKKQCFITSITDSGKEILMYVNSNYICESKKDAKIFCKKDREEYREYLEIMRLKNRKPHIGRSKLKIYELNTNLDLFERLKQEKEESFKRFKRIVKSQIIMMNMAAIGMRILSKRRLCTSQNSESTQKEHGVK